MRPKMEEWTLNKKAMKITNDKLDNKKMMKMVMKADKI